MPQPRESTIGVRVDLRMAGWRGLDRKSLLEFSPGTPVAKCISDPNSDWKPDRETNREQNR